MFFEYKIKKRAFTVAEVLIAALVFSIMAVGVFGLFRMGSNMYLSGSWKFNKQKEAERFLNNVKERMEQASNPAKIDVNGSGGFELRTNRAGFFVNNFTGIRDVTSANLAVGARLYLAEFVIAKVDKRNVTINGGPGDHGLIYYLSLYCEGQRNGYASLCLHMNNRTDDGFFVNPTPGGTPTTFTFVPPSLGDAGGIEYDGAASLYSLPNVPQTITLEDVSNIEITGGVYASGAAQLRDTVMGINVTMKCPKHDKTTLTLKMNAKVDRALEFAYVGF